MKATALLILLVAFVCTSEALKCYNMDIGIEQCPDAVGVECLHYRHKKTGVEFKRCVGPNECSHIEAGFPGDDVPEIHFNCCSDKDLCNVEKMECPEV